MILYITRKFPPSIGGMQRFNDKLVSNLRRKTQIYLISWGGSQAALPFFWIYAFIKALLACFTKPIDCIYVADGLLSTLGLSLKIVTKKPVLCNIHGRDIAFEFKPYQYIVPRCLKRLDRIICVSHGLKNECIKRGVPPDLICVIPNGVDAADFNIYEKPVSISEAEKLIKQKIGDNKILLSVGRLIPKKGIVSFLLNIFPKITEKFPNAFYLIVGGGRLKNQIKDIIRENHYEDKVFLLGEIPMNSSLLSMLFKAADIFIMPNIPVRDDIEGFGIVILEAAASGVCVVASKTDGIEEAVIEKQNGFLIPHDQYEEFASKVVELLRNNPLRETFGHHARQFVQEHFSWERIAQTYLDEFKPFLHEKDSG